MGTTRFLHRLGFIGTALLAACLADGCTAVSPYPTGSSSVEPSGGGDGDTGSSGGSVGNLVPDASACQPGDVQTYQPGAYHAAHGVN